MPRKVLTVQENRDRIVRVGTEVGAARFNVSRKLFLQAMRDIEADIERNGGIYPYANGRVSVAEVVRRAGKSNAYLRRNGSEQLLNLRQEVAVWVIRVNSAIVNGASVVRKMITVRVREAKDELANVRQAYAEAELVLSETLAELQTCHQEIKELRAANASLIEAQSNGTIISLNVNRD
ncbi:hypothetical protein SAMN05216374_5450 [Tardiphaga sp. OK246]|jgi:hypothetical protein|uniref:hypothetical protein n=1 Tax=Tardiphaga sp. OK246 TaxID=1855307 RepID=UPI000B6C0F35|nr:hypothetical protein [Tardiphaga sp. OK246]SNT59565.1 hypothetical protein SAMN05216374_5450 [Tardiphaga sp. OK246]